MKFKLTLLLLLFAITIFGQQKRALTVEDMWAMKRVGDVVLSPDGKTLAFSVTQYDMGENDGQTDIYLIDADGKNLRPVKNSKKNETQPQFTPDGKNITYKFEGQIWQCDLQGKNDVQLTDIYTKATGVVWANDGSKFLFTSMVYPECNDNACNKKIDDEKAANKIEAEVFTELMYRHWDDWRGPKRSHLFVFDVNSQKATDLTPNSKFDTPPLALGSSSDYAISPDGKEVAYTMNTEEFLAASTNNDIFILDITKEGFDPIRISKSKGNDNQPVYSPNGEYIAFRSMARAGFEADKQTLMIYNRKTKELNNISDNLDISFGEIIWAPNSKLIYYTATNQIYTSIYRIQVKSGKNELIYKERVNTNILVNQSGNKLYFKQQRSYLPNEIFTLNSNGSDLKQITFMNKELLAEIEMNEIENFWAEGADGTKVQSILVKPPFFDPSKKYPVIFLVHGGPQGNWDDNFHYRWNTQMFASQGHVVIATNPRGSTGYGQKFTDEITKDWGGKVYEDLMNSLDYAFDTYDFLDKNNIFAAGASYGGYMMNWILAQPEVKFNALVNHDGVYNLESMYGTTEELWFLEWEYGGTPWDNPELYKKWSPSSYVKNFKTPMLVIHGGMDFRVPESQAFELFTALQKMGVESKFLYFPKETHFVLKPQNARFWWKNVFEWFKKFER